LIALIRQPVLTSVMKSAQACWIDSASQAACRLSRRCSTRAGTAPTPQALSSSMLLATLRKLLLPVSNPRVVATATPGMIAASTSRTTNTTLTVGPCQRRDLKVSFLLGRLRQRRLEMSPPGTTRGRRSIAGAPLLLILHLDTRALLALLVKRYTISQLCTGRYDERIPQLRTCSNAQPKEIYPCGELQKPSVGLLALFYYLGVFLPLFGSCYVCFLFLCSCVRAFCGCASNDSPRSAPKEIYQFAALCCFCLGFACFRFGGGWNG
jgi:hypothetical protein